MKIRGAGLQSLPFPEREWPQFQALLKETNILSKTASRLLAGNFGPNEVHLNSMKFLNLGSYRTAYLTAMSLPDGREKEVIFKISQGASSSHIWHQIMGATVNPSGGVDAKTGGLWQLSNKQVVLTEEYIPGPTFDEFISTGRPDEEKTKVAAILIEKCFFFWGSFHQIFISDPHRRQFIISRTAPPFDVRFVDTGYVSTRLKVSYEIPNNGSVLIKDQQGEILYDNSWIYKTPPGKILNDLIFYLEAPNDGMAGGDYVGINDGYHRAYDLPRSALFSGIMNGLKEERATEYFPAVRGIDPELDDIARDNKML